MTESADKVYKDLPKNSRDALDVLNDLTGVAADIGEFIAGDDVRKFAYKASRVAKGLGFVGAAFGIVFDVAQMLDPDYKSPEEELLTGLTNLGNKIDNLQKDIDRQFEALKRDMTITNWSIAVSEDVNYVQLAVNAMLNYNKAVTEWKDSIAPPDGSPRPPSRDLKVATDELRKYRSQELLVALANIRSAATGQGDQQLVGLLELFSPNQTRVTRSFASTVSLLAQGSDVYCILLYLDFMESNETASGLELKPTVENEIKRARKYAERECEPLVEAVRAEYLRLMSPYAYLELGWKTIQQVSSGRNLDAHQSASHDYRAVTRKDVTDTRWWKISLVTEGQYTIQQVSSGRNLDAHQSASHDYRAVTREGITNTRLWRITALADDNSQYTIEQISSGRNLDAHQSASHDFMAVTRKGLTDTRIWSIKDEMGKDQTWTDFRDGLEEDTS